MRAVRGINPHCLYRGAEVGVQITYDDHRVLDNGSFTAKTGEVTALVGPSASGKTTCAHLAARLWDVSAGTITVGGIDISGVDPEALLGHYSVIFQDATLFDNTVMENIRLGKFGATEQAGSSQD